MNKEKVLMLKRDLSLLTRARVHNKADVPRLEKEILIKYKVKKVSEAVELYKKYRYLVV